MPQAQLFDPENWMPSLFRSLREYVSTGIDNYVKLGNTPVGLQAYEIVFDFPTALADPDKLPFRNDDGDPITLIHFEIDNIENTPVGFGDGVYDSALLLAPDYTVTTYEAQGHEINFDVGVWATDASGGATSRLETYQALSTILDGPGAQNACQEATGGILVRSFSGGRFLTETLNDIRLYRVVDCSLVTFVYSKKVNLPDTASDIVIDPELFIDETIIVDIEP